MKAIYKRELKAYFQTVIGWLFIAAIMIFTGIYFVAYNMLYRSPYIANALGSALFIMIIAVPLLTMRVIAEERKNKTDQLILTAPVSLGKIIAAKYFALATIYMIPMVVICSMPLIMSRFGTVSMGESYTAILGFVLYGLACLAVGMFISSITESQVIAVILSLITMVLLYLMEGLCSMISSGGNIVTKILNGCFDFYGRFTAMMQGCFDIKSIIYFVTVIVLMLFLTAQSIQKRRWSVSSKAIGRGVYSTTLIVVAVCAAVLVNVVAGEIPEKYSAIDVTSNKMYSLTEETETLVKEIREDITIYVLSSENNMDATVDKTLDRYKDLNPHIKVVYKDPYKYPNFAGQYTSDSVSQGSLIVVGEKRNKVIDQSNLYATEFDYSTYQSYTSGYDAEGQITSALDFVTSESMPKIYFIEGHDELQLDSTYMDAITKENIDTETINLMNYDEIPEDAECIMLLGPVSDYSEDDAQKVKDYLQKGNKAFIVASYSDQKLTNFESILADYGITLPEGVVAEADQNHYYQSPFYLLPDVNSSTETAAVYGSKYVFAPLARGMQIAEDREDLSVNQLLTTTENSYVKSDVSNMETYEKEEGDIDGPFALGATVEKTEEDGSASKIAVFTSDGMFAKEADSMVSGANLSVFSATISSFVDHASTVSIPVKSYDAEYLTVPQTSALLVGAVFVVIIPLVLIVAGIVIWVRRRRR